LHLKIRRFYLDKLMKTLNLAGVWKLSAPSRNLEMSALLPGDNHSALLKAGKIPDPFWADNELQVQWIGREDWIYEREFKVPASALKENSVYLNIEHLDAIAAVKINGHIVAKINNAFVRLRVEIKKFLKAGGNRITLEFTSPEKAANTMAAKMPYAIPFSPAPVQSPHRNLIRKTQCHSGWDWGICLMVSGVYGSIYIGTTSVGRIEYVYTEQKHSRSAVDLTVHCEVDSPAGGRTPFEIEFGDQKVSTTVTLQPGLNRLKKVVHIPQAKLWWPNGFGAQALYHLTVRVGGDELRKRIGLRTIEVVYKNDKDGLSLVFVVNGKPIFCKGANWIPADALPQRATRAVLDDLLSSAADAHMNIIRVWGGGTYESDDFYDLCDEKGLLIWQDFMFACSTYPASDEFLDNVREEARHQVKRLRDHTCLALWCGNNENVGALSWYPETRANRDRYLVDYDRLNEGVLGDTVRELDPTRLFWPSSPCGGPGDYSDCWHDNKRGDMHSWEVWHESKPFERYLELTPRFCSEFGYQSFPSVEGIRTYAPPDQFNVTSPILEHHQRNVGGNTRITENMTRYFRFPEGFENFVYLSQVQQALAIKMGVEHFRSLRPLCMGAIYWQLNDLWPVCSWSSLEYGGKWKLLHYLAKRFFAPVLITAKQMGDTVEIYGLNDQFEALAATARLRVIDFSGKVLKTLRFSHRLAAGSSTLLKKIPLKDLVKNPNEAFLSLELKAGSKVIRNEHFFTVYKRCMLKKPRVSMKIAQAPKGFTVTLTTDVPAFWVRLDVTGVRGEFDDNGFALLPGASKRLLFTPKEKTTLAAFGKNLTLRSLRDTYA
jgi:beta-mannosidase